MSDLTFDQMKEMIKLGAKLKVKYLSFRDQNLTVGYGSGSSLDSAELKGDRVPTEDELLYWSTDYTPEINSEPPE